LFYKRRNSKMKLIYLGLEPQLELINII
jgi:hypothetical protein